MEESLRFLWVSSRKQERKVPWKEEEDNLGQVNSIIKRSLIHGSPCPMEDDAQFVNEEKGLEH